MTTPPQDPTTQPTPQYATQTFAAQPTPPKTAPAINPPRWRGRKTAVAAALAIGPGEPRPDLTVVVLDDRGGGIFSTLEHGVGLDDAGRARFERVFATPTGTDLAAICAAHGVDHVRVTSLRALRGALADRVGATGTGLRVVTVAVDRDGHRGIRSALAGPTE